MKYKKRAAIEYGLFLCFCMIYRFIITGRNENNSFYSIYDFTVNTQNYMTYIHTSTFYTLFFAFILNGMIIKMNEQSLIRLSRGNIVRINIIRSAVASLIFCIIFLLPHIVFMTKEFGVDRLYSIDFYSVTVLQLFANILYFILTSQIYLFIYYNTLSGVISCVFLFCINALLMFAYRILKFSTPIKFTLIYSGYYNEYKSISEMLRSVILLMPVIAVIVFLSRYNAQERDVL